MLYMYTKHLLSSIHTFRLLFFFCFVSLFNSSQTSTTTVQYMLNDWTCLMPSLVGQQCSFSDYSQQRNILQNLFKQIIFHKTLLFLFHMKLLLFHVRNLKLLFNLHTTDWKHFSMETKVLSLLLQYLKLPVQWVPGTLLWE